MPNVPPKGNADLRKNNFSNSPELFIQIQNLKFIRSTHILRETWLFIETSFTGNFVVAFGVIMI